MNNLQQKKKVQIQIQNKSIYIKNANIKHSFLILSTEPSRKIMKNPQIVKDDIIEFNMCELEQINNKLQGFCCVQFQNCMSQICGKYQKLSELGRKTKQVFFTNFIIQVNPNDWKFQDQKLSKISNRNTKSSTSTNQNKYLQMIPPRDIDAHKIQSVIQYSQRQHGRSQKLKAVKNYLIVDYQKQIQIKQGFIINKLSQNKNGNIQLSYWTITHHRIMYAIQPKTLIQLPSQSKIKRMIIHSTWIIFSTLNEPLQFFLTLPLQSQQICCFQKYKYIYIYQLYTYKNPQYITKMKIRKLQPYCFVFKQDMVLMGGINYSSILNQPQQQKQILIIKKFAISQQKSLLADQSLKICQQQKHIPISNILYIKNVDLFACSCGTNLYIFHLESKIILTNISMKNYIRRIYRVPTTYNLFSIYLKVGFETCGQQLGTEVENMKQYGKYKDFTVLNDLILTNGKLIQNLNRKQILTSIDCLIGEEKEQIRKICCNEDYLCFLTSTSYKKKMYFIQL